MTRRRRLTERQTLAVAVSQGAVIPCFRCRLAFDAESVKTAEREHLHERGLDGGEDLGNFRYSHKECHDLITNGSKATTAGSSKQRIAKVKRVRGETKTGPKAKIANRGFRKPPPGYKHFSRTTEQER